ncbi:MAG: hypothetical protein JWO31_2355, partial [Phycisphaerales bacterium]|nr:hypothetical protein [Phycisphaerales bacterium]
VRRLGWSAVAVAAAWVYGVGNKALAYPARWAATPGSFDEAGDRAADLMAVAAVAFVLVAVAGRMRTGSWPGSPLRAAGWALAAAAGLGATASVATYIRFSDRGPATAFPVADAVTRGWLGAVFGLVVVRVVPRPLAVASADDPTARAFEPILRPPVATPLPTVDAHPAGGLE